MPPIYYDGTQLPYTHTFKSLGMVCDKAFNLNVAADAALRPFTAGTFRVEKFSSGTRPCQPSASPDPNLAWLLKIYVGVGVGF